MAMRHALGLPLGTTCTEKADNDALAPAHNDAGTCGEQQCGATWQSRDIGSQGTDVESTPPLGAPDGACVHRAQEDKGRDVESTPQLGAPDRACVHRAQENKGREVESTPPLGAPDGACVHRAQANSGVGEQVTSTTSALNGRSVSGKTEEATRVLELFCGIGGMRLALSYAGFKVEPVAVDINDDCLFVYEHNWPRSVLVRKTISSLSLEWFRAQHCSIWTMSPPCQPYSRQGNFSDMEDNRCQALLHIIEVLLSLEEVDLPKLILLENVAGFEQSVAYGQLNKALVKRGYFVEPFMLTPSQALFPNSRLRFFLTAQRNPRVTPGIADIRRQLCCNAPYGKLFLAHFDIDPNTPLLPNDHTRCCHNLTRMLPSTSGTDVRERPQIGQFLDHGRDTRPLEVPPPLLEKRSAACFDVVFPTCAHSMCFTKNYGRYLQGTGSVIVGRHVPSPGGAGSAARPSFSGFSPSLRNKQPRSQPESKAKSDGKDATASTTGVYPFAPVFDTSVSDPSASDAECVNRLRFFHPNEVLRLMGYKLSHRTSPDAPPIVQPPSHPDHQCLPCKCFRTAPCRCETFEIPKNLEFRRLWKMCGNSLNPQIVGQVLMNLPAEMRA
eukprot:GEMP01013304.1.p1 GENE.GEMP01013304.1~~GEMP01013304.1.p1  ORF type:complete len:611 (+),score=132.00 GEMP01013304.1:244-2076(+)